jgi:hypothetical protein
MTEANTIGAVVARAAQRWPDARALVDGDLQLTFRELETHVGATAAALASRGVSPGTFVAIWAPNSAQWVLTALAVAQAGATLVPISTRSKGPEAADIIGRSHASMLLTVSDFLGVDYAAMLRATGEPSGAAGDAAARRPRGAPARAGRLDVARPRRRTTSATCSSPRAPPADRRGHAPSPHSAAPRDWCRAVGLAPATATHREPDVPCVGAQDRCAGVPHPGATVYRARCSIGRRDGQRRARIDHGAVGPPTIYQALLATRARRVRPLVAAPRGHGCGVDPQCSSNGCETSSGSRVWSRRMAPPRPPAS